jgi:hypothetical protein
MSLLEVSYEAWYSARPMAQARHRGRERRTLAQGAEAIWWRASRYKLDNEDDPAFIEAAPNATWERFRPFDLYKPTSRVREVRAGPHLLFLRLERVMEEQPELFHKTLILFAKEYGLLGAFEQDYLEQPVLPEGKNLVAPEALIDYQGRLRRIDPPEIRQDFLRAQLSYRRYLPNNSSIALPSEVRFSAKHPILDREWWPTFQPPRPVVPWEEIQEDFGALFILDEEAFTGVSVLCTREPLARWRHSLVFFPSVDTPVEQLVNNEGFPDFNAFLQEVSPRVVIREDGNLDRSWYCRSLIQAMYAMLYLDLTGGNTIKKCRSWGCSNSFRVGPQTKSIYCSDQCASRASTRRGRGQEPWSDDDFDSNADSYPGERRRTTGNVGLKNPA